MQILGCSYKYNKFKIHLIVILRNVFNFKSVFEKFFLIKFKNHLWY